MKKYKDILGKAKQITTNVEKKQKLGVSSKWSYYIAKAVVNNKKDVKSIEFDKAPKPKGTHISRQLTKSNYLDLAKQLIKFVEHHKRLPNYLVIDGTKIRTRLYTLMFAKILISYEKNGKLPNTVNVNSKAFTKPTETGNIVYDTFVKTYGYAPKTLDEILTFVKKYFKYLYYYDDKKSNKEVTISKSGNCTDLLQWLFNMVKALGYETRCIHVKCKLSGSGHVRGQFKHSKHTNGKWIDRDPASVADGGSINSLWCKDGTVIAVNPQWFLSNLNR